MTARGEPTRWREEPTQNPPGISEALRSYGAQRASDGERRQLLERLAPWLEASGPDLASLTRARRLSMLGRTGLLVALGAAAAWLAAQHEPRLIAPQPAVHSAAPAVATEPRQVAPAVSTIVTGAAQAPAGLTKRETAPSKVRKRVVESAPLVAAAPGIAAERELELLRKAHEALRRNPTLVRELLAEHARDYPHGVFEQEREMLRVELAVTRGQHAHARELAQSFLARFGGSTYQHQLEALLATNIAREDSPASDTHSMDSITHE